MINAAGTPLRCVGDETLDLEPCPEGPVLVRGATMIIDEDDQAHPVLRPVVAVCRCGTSTQPPWCDGMHKLVQRRQRAAGADQTER
ncbi:CDGSH iron-sulfur domain-containing protein [Microlunatus parietis]|uniref:CDGSH-type Zn-finger protein n=1 Tax=Microlunatus parietis TaxID=682979 RepID=A0A7Y9I3A3_9ACTN|nr:CDGSH iron-sulfur domain-containing protein [Microlunatus parietis]NYE69446.1 CDGSH-type Zn-finger protein [Microlunatus parietis]